MMVPEWLVQFAILGLVGVLGWFMREAFKEQREGLRELFERMRSNETTTAVLGERMEDLERTVHDIPRPLRRAGDKRA